MTKVPLFPYITVGLGGEAAHDSSSNLSQLVEIQKVLVKITLRLVLLLPMPELRSLKLLQLLKFPMVSDVKTQTTAGDLRGWLPYVCPPVLHTALCCPPVIMSSVFQGFWFKLALYPLVKLLVFVF